MEKLAFVDVETTGSDPLRDRVMEIGILRVEDNEIVTKINTLVNPQTSVPPFIQSMTGINSEHLSRAPLFDEVMADVLESLDDCIFVAHNARFDYAFIKNEFLRYDVKFRAKVLCTVRLSRNLYPQHTRHNLDALIERHGIQCKSRHRAYDDASVLWDFCEIAKKDVGETNFLAAVDELIQTPSLPAQIEKQFIDDLPDSPGVYLFYGPEDVLLYVGKSTDIHARVRSHFTSDYLSEKDLRIAKQLTRIDTVTTAGELGALLRESQMIKDMSPIYNKQLRRHNDLVFALRSNGGGYNTITLTRGNPLGLEDVSNLYGVFKSKKQAKEELYALAKEYNLCPSLLGIEPSRTGCFYRQIGLCFGACVGDEDTVSYNMRFAQAFASLKIPQWENDEVFAVEESNHRHKEVHYIHNWVHLGSIEMGEDIETHIVHIGTRNFDLDTYKILKRFLRNPKKRARVRVARKDELLVLSEG